MAYSIIEPPFTLKFREMPKKELLAYRQWFHEQMPERLTELANVVTSTSGYEHWEPDLAPDSLALLGEWFCRQVESRTLSDAEIEDTKARLIFPIDVPKDDLTNRTFSLAIDIGMYFGQVVVKNLPGTQWDQEMRSRHSADYGQPVINGFGKVPLNPVMILVTLAYALADGNQSGGRLRALYDIWRSMRA